MRPRDRDHPTEPSPIASVLRALCVAATILVVATSCGGTTYGNAAPSVTSTPAAVVSAAPAEATPPPAKSGGAVATYVSCGVVSANTTQTGEGSGPDTVQLASPTGVFGARFGWIDGRSALGTYVCARLIPGAPMSALDRLIGPGDPGYVSTETAATDSCGAVTGYAADGLRMLMTLTVGAVATQYRLAYQFAGEAAPIDIGTRLVAHTPQLLLITGRQVPSDPGSPSAIDLHDHNVARVTSCTPLSSVAPQPVGFTLPPGCAYIGQPEVGADQTSWLFDCGWASRGARATLAPALLAQGWTSCGAVTATAAWAKGSARLAVAEGAGGFNGYPRLAQFRVGIQTSCP